MSILKIIVNTKLNSFSFEEMNLSYKYVDVEFIFTDDSDILGLEFGYTASCLKKEICTRKFNEDFAYRVFEKEAYFNTSRVENFSIPHISIHAWVKFLDGSIISEVYDLGLPAPVKPFNSWILGDNGWEPPVPIPSEDFSYRWDEEIQAWIKVEWSEILNKWIDI